jgi:hypothetical protein
MAIQRVAVALLILGALGPAAAFFSSPLTHGLFSPLAKTSKASGWGQSTCPAVGDSRRSCARIHGRQSGLIGLRAEADYYAQLGVSRGASDKEIKSAFRQKARKLHPDVNKAPNAQQQFQEIQNAYEVLSDPQKKSMYDRYENPLSALLLVCKPPRASLLLPWGVTGHDASPHGFV